MVKVLLLHTFLENQASFTDVRESIPRDVPSNICPIYSNETFNLSSTMLYSVKSLNNCKADPSLPIRERENVFDKLLSI